MNTKGFFTNYFALKEADGFYAGNSPPDGVRHGLKK
jgi:hypothetical protein